MARESKDFVAQQHLYTSLPMNYSLVAICFRIMLNRYFEILNDENCFQVTLHYNFVLLM